jgi:hypothetical protein
MTPVWRKSSRSGSSGSQSDCVEVARLSRNIGLRDSKTLGAGHLTLSAEGFADLVARVKRDELNA